MLDINYVYLLHESECDTAKYFIEQCKLIHFIEPEVSEHKAWEWNI